MQPCPTCGRMDVDANGYCPGCGTYRGAPGYDAGGQYGHQTSAPPYGGPSSGAPYGGPSSGAPYGGPSSGAPYGGQPYQQAQPQQPYGYTDPNYTPSFVSPPATSRRPSTVPLIMLSVVAVILVVGIVAVVVARSGGGGGTDDPTTGSTAGATNTAAAGLDTCVVGKWRVASAREKVEVAGSLVEFSASGGTYEFRGDGTGTVDYSSGVVYRATVADQAVTITLTGSATFSYKTVDKTITYSNPSAKGEAVLRSNGVVTTSVPLEYDTKPNSYTCSGSSLTLTTDLATTELRK